MERSNSPTAYLGFGRIHLNIAASDAQEPLNLFMECAIGSFDMRYQGRVIGADRSTTERLLLSIGARKAKARKSGRSIRSEYCFHT
jgi:hypothetical protein